LSKIDITSTTVKRAKADAVPGAKQSEISDARQAGLVIRIGARGARWQFRFEAGGKGKRIDLGSIDDWTIAEAREVAGKAAAMVRNKQGLPTEEWLLRQRIAYGKIDAPAIPTATTPTEFGQWTFAEAKADYLAEVKRIRRLDTWDDYAKVLAAPELDELADQKVGRITRHDLSRIVVEIHRSGRQRAAEKLAGCLRTMWSHLERDAYIRKSGVEFGSMLGLRAPERSLVERGNRSSGGIAPGRYVPSLLELGRIVAICRSGAMPPQIAAAIELLVMTVQRRRPIASAWKADFEPIGEGRGLWHMPPAARKSGARRDPDRDHVVPLPGSVWSLVERIRATDELGDWMFPAFRARRTGSQVTHMAPSTVTHALLWMPGTEASPHDIRRAFSTHGEKALGWTRLASKQILDHGEGEAAGDVTAASYALHDGAHQKWPTMVRWVDAVEDHVGRAIAADQRLLDADWLRAQIVKLRYERPGSEAQTAP
jgi:integrase